MPDFIQTQPKKPKQNRVLAGVIFFIMLLVGGAVTGAVYYLQEQNISRLEDDVQALNQRIEDEQNTFDLEKEELELELETLKDEMKVQEEMARSVKTFSDGIAVTAEVPVDWSVFKNPERVAQDSLPDLPTASIASDEITFGDSNAEQVDLYYAEEDIIDELIEQEKEIDGVEFSEETVAGEQVQVATYPLDENGESTKEGSGGKTYFIQLDQRVKTLVIKKQTAGDSEYEDEFDAFLSKIQIQFSE